jgi:hypothetical protein
MISAARAAAGEPTDVEPISGEEENDEEEQEELLEHRFRLRPDMVVPIELPADITAAEAERLSNFIHSIPF